jgi:hypothetical protein
MDLMGDLIGLLMIVGCVAFGFALGSGWAPVVPVALSFLYYQRIHADYEGGDTLDFLVLFAGAFYALLVLFGVVLRKARTRGSERKWYLPS